MIRLLLCLAVLVPVGQAEAQYQVIPPVQRVPPQPSPPQRAAPIKVVPVIDASQPCRKPVYPGDAEQREGLVELQLRVETDGHVSDSRIVRSSGLQSLDEAARSALALCHFKPGTTDGEPQAAWATIRYNWVPPQ